MSFVEVRILDTSLRHLDRAFTYTTETPLEVGAAVRVVFHGRLVNGIVVAQAEPFDKARPIKAIRGPGLLPWALPLAQQIALTTLGEPASILAAMLPERVSSEEAKVPVEPLSIGESFGSGLGSDLGGDRIEFTSGLGSDLGGDRIEFTSGLGSDLGDDRVLFAPGLGSDYVTPLAALAHQELASGGTVLVVLPESDKTSTLATAMLSVGGESAAWLGSDASPRLRYRAWLRLRHGVARLAIGGRSAVLAPVVPTLIIVADEASSSLKEPRNPRYHAREVAKQLAEFHGARLLLCGTPASIESRIDADPRRNKLSLVKTPNQIKPQVRVLEPSGLVPAPATIKQLSEAKERICVLVHRSEYLAPAAERISRQLKRSVAILDASSTSQEILDAARADGPQALVASPVIASDMRIENVDTLAILGADAALITPTFRAAEELISSWWRTVNATRPIRILIESSDREHHCIQALLKLDHDVFALKEAQQRHSLGYPPYRKLIRISVARSDMSRLVSDLQGHNMLGPMDDPLDSQLQVIALRGDQRMVEEVRPLITSWRAEGLRVKIDVDPWDLLEDKWRS